MPVTELGLVAAAGALGLTGHWIGHGCEGGGPGSVGSPTAPPGSHVPTAPSSAGQTGRGHQAAHGGDTTAPPPSFQPRLGTDTPVCPHRHCLLRIWLSCGWGAPASLGKGGCHFQEGLRGAAASSTSGPGVLGSLISRGLWGAIRRHLSSKPGVPRGGKPPGSRDWKGCWFLQ